MKKQMSVQQRPMVRALAACCAWMLSVCFLFCATDVSVVAEESDTALRAAWVQLSPDEIVARHAFDAGKALTPGEEVALTLDLPTAGSYRLVLRYEQEEYPAFGNNGTVTVNGASFDFNLGGVWYDEDSTPLPDRYGNEIISNSVPQSGIILNYIQKETDYAHVYSLYDFVCGENTVSLRVTDVTTTVYELLLVRESAYSGLSKTAVQNGKQILIPAEKYDWKSDSYIHADNVQSEDVTPYQVENKKLNILDGSVFDTHAQKIAYSFYVEEEGDYRLAVRYNQDSKKGMSVYRTIEIDGRAPAACFENISFAYTGMDWETMTVKNGNKDAYIHLTEGWHTMTVLVSSVPTATYRDRLATILSKLSEAGLSVKMITGGQTDANRTWDIEKYLPTIVEDLYAWADELDAIYSELETLSGQLPSFASALPKSAQYLRIAADSPRTLPAETGKIFEGSGSVAQMIGDLLTPLLQQQMDVDSLFLYSAEEPMEEYPGFFERLWNEIRRFLMSFVSDYGDYGSIATSGEVLDVWVNRPLMAVETLQMLADSDFTVKTGIPVKVSIMPNEEKIILANAAGKTPDVAMGLSLARPYELGLRDAVVDLYEFEDFLDVYTENYDPRLLIPLWVDGRMSGIVENRNFQVLFYRKDILERLGLDVPNTWEDVKLIMPVLKRNGMNLHLSLASHSGNKPISTTSYFYAQHGTSLYAEDGMTTIINNTKGYESFEMLTSLFATYSVPVNTESFFNNFRYGRTPVGVSNLDTYIRLKNAAPELAGLWDIAPAPGWEDENGVVHREQTGAAETAVIMKQTEMKDEAWAFLKWWISTETQVEYGTVMQTKFGPTYIWNSANEEAFLSTGIEKRHLDIIFEQWEWTYEVPQHPAAYMLERELSNAWNSVVVNQREPRAMLDKAVININREMERKLQEFGFVKDGVMVRPYEIATLEKILEGGRS